MILAFGLGFSLANAVKSSFISHLRAKMSAHTSSNLFQQSGTKSTIKTFSKKLIRLGALGALFAASAWYVSGCSLLDYIQRKASQGNISGDNWYIERIVVGDEVFYAPQIIAKSAQKMLNSDAAELPKVQKDKHDSADVDVLDSAQIPNLDDIDDNKLKELAQIDEIATLNFDTTQGRISGQSGCGSYFASYTWSDRKNIEISGGGLTRKLCSPNEVVRFEFRFVRGLEGAFGVAQKDKNTLTLTSKNMTIYLYKNKDMPKAEEDENPENARSAVNAGN